jgi:2-dehydropantoate 2-reductase
MMRGHNLLPNFRIAIVGAGAIGCYYGGKLASFGRDVHFLMRGDTSAVRKSGLRIRGKTENIHVAKVNVHQTTAEIGPCTHEISWEFKRCGIVSSVVGNLALERWRKLAWNIPFNGLSVTTGGIDTATILANDHLRLTTLALMDEVIAAANKCGIRLRTAAALEQMRRTETMGAYKPSSLIDFENGRPLEIEAIWGEPLRRATAAGARMPRLEELYSSLRALDGRSRPRRKVGSP